MPGRTAPLPAYNYHRRSQTDRATRPSCWAASRTSPGWRPTSTSPSTATATNPSRTSARFPGSHKVGDVTLKRGVVDSSDLWAWITDTRTNGVAAQRDVIITLRDEAGNPVQKWKLRNVVPMKYTGPTLAGKGGGDVAMEELVLSAEGYEIAPASS